MEKVQISAKSIYGQQHLLLAQMHTTFKNGRVRSWIVAKGTDGLLRRKPASDFSNYKKYLQILPELTEKEIELFDFA